MALCRIAWETFFKFLSATNIDKRSHMQIREKKRGVHYLNSFDQISFLQKIVFLASTEGSKALDDLL